MLNIGGDQNDESYRYKMPVLVTKTEGRGNGIKTALVNINDVAKALHVPAMYPTKYFGFELGTQANYNPDEEKGIINGKHEVNELQRILDKFIESFVLCPGCRLPEINMRVRSKSDIIRIECAACGHKSNLDSAHRLCAFIVKNPPPKSVASGAHRNKEQERRKKDTSDDTKNELDIPIPLKAGAKSGQEVEWVTDSSAEARKRRQLEEFGSVDQAQQDKLDKIDAILEAAKAINAENASSTLLKIFLVQNEPTVGEIIAELRRIQLSRALDDAQKFKLVLECFIDTSDPAAVAKQFSVPRTAKLLTAMINNDEALATLLINCLEDFCGVIHPQLLPRFPFFIKELYEHDVLTQEAIIKWFEQPPEASWFVQVEIGRNTRKRSGPFVEWLRDDDEDEDDEDEDAE